jgi:hypothetical protein
MAVTTTTSSVTYTASGSETSFAVPFRFLEDTHLVVTLNGAELTKGSEYSVRGAGGSSGYIVPLDPLAGELVITRVVPVTQPTTFRLAGTFSPRSHEDAFDRQAMIVQQVDRDAQAAIAAEGVARAEAGAALADLITATGPTNRTGAVFSVIDFAGGATINDGSTDASPAIQAALNAMVAAGGGTVYFPKGKYRCATMGTTAGGGWCCFQAYFTTPNLRPVALIGEDGAEIWYDVTGKKDASSAHLFGFGSDYSASGYTIAQKIAQTRWYLQGLTVRNLVFRGWRGQNHTDIELSQANQALYLDLCEDVEVTGCAFYDSVGGSCFYNINRRFTFHHNSHRNVNAGVQGNISQHVRISDNTFECPFKCDDQIGIFGYYGGSAADPYRSRHVVIQNNVIDKRFDGDKLWASGTNRGWGRGICLQGTDELLVSGNIIVNNNSASALDLPAIPDQNPGSGHGGIVVESYSDIPDRNVAFIGNTIRNCRWGLRLTGPTENLRIANNIFDNLEFYGVCTGVNSVQSEVAGQNLVIESNTFSGCGRSTDYVTGTSSFAIRTYNLDRASIARNHIVACKGPWLLDCQSELSGGTTYYPQVEVSIVGNEILCDPADTSAAYPNSGMARVMYPEALRFNGNRFRGRWGIGAAFPGRGSMIEVSDNWVEDHATVSDSAGFDYNNASAAVGHAGAVVVSAGNWIKTYGNTWSGNALRRKVPRGAGTPTSEGGWSAYEEAMMGPEIQAYVSGVTLPTATAAHRGLMAMRPGGAGAADYFAIGHKNTADTYEWRPILCQLSTGAAAVSGATNDTGINGLLWQLYLKLQALGIVAGGGTHT